MRKKGNDLQLKKFLIVEQILPVNILGNLKGKVSRIAH